MGAAQLRLGERTTVGSLSATDAALTDDKATVGSLDARDLDHRFARGGKGTEADTSGLLSSGLGLLKDADVFHHYLYNPALKDGWETNARLKALFAELGAANAHGGLPDDQESDQWR